MSEPLSIDDAREHFSELVESVAGNRERITVRTPDGGEVILMNAEDLESPLTHAFQVTPTTFAVGVT